MHRTSPRQVQQQCEAQYMFYQGADRGTPEAQHKIPSPAVWEAPINCLGRVYSVAVSAIRGAQAERQVAAQRGTTLNEQS
jgi:hypothetical protein